VYDKDKTQEESLIGTLSESKEYTQDKEHKKETSSKLTKKESNKTKNKSKKRYVSEELDDDFKKATGELD